MNSVEKGTAIGVAIAELVKQGYRLRLTAEEVGQISGLGQDARTIKKYVKEGVLPKAGADRKFSLGDVLAACAFSSNNLPNRSKPKQMKDFTEDWQ